MPTFHKDFGYYDDISLNLADIMPDGVEVEVDDSDIIEALDSLDDSDNLTQWVIEEYDSNGEDSVLSAAIGRLDPLVRMALVAGDVQKPDIEIDEDKVFEWLNGDGAGGVRWTNLLRRAFEASPLYRAVAANTLISFLFAAPVPAATTPTEGGE
jgi:hypothetical protein